MAKKKKTNNNNNSTAESKELFVYAEITKNNDILEPCPVIFELLNSARNLALKYTDNTKVCAILCHKTDISENIDNIKKSLYLAGADKIYYIKSENIKSYIGVAKSIAELCKVKKPEIFLIGATMNGRTIAPLVASMLETGLTADCTKLEITNYKDEKKLASSRPTFGGQLMATILCKKTPQMATVRPSVLPKAETPYKEDGEFEDFIPSFENFNDPITTLGTEINKDKFSSELENAQIIVAGGKGLKSEENFEKLKKFASLIDAAVAGSRGAVDMGLIDKQYQIGQTGKTVAPKIYMAFGISGAIHHMVGINNAKKIIAINNDENAPIFENSDIAITTDAITLLDELIEELENPNK